MQAYFGGVLKILAIAGWVLVAVLCSSPIRANSSAAAACQALERADFSSIPDAPTQVMEAEIVDAKGEVPAHCLVQGYIWPQVGFEMQLPSSAWNGKFLEVGCGGFCGFTRTQGTLHAGWCDDALRRGYACVVSNMGHSSSKEGHSKNLGSDGLWAYNNLQAEVDFGFRAAHITALAGKAITRHHYGADPKFSYFFGCSQGGRQGLVEAQRFPWDFDGIIAMDPGINFNLGGSISQLWNALALRDGDGKSLFDRADLDVLHKGAIAACDADDGLEDGIIGDPRTCKFDPAELVCEKGSESGCLSSAQVAAAKKLYGGAVTSKGEQLYYGVMPGAERGYLGFGTKPQMRTNFFRYMGFMPDPGPSWKAGDFDFDVDYKRLGMMAMIHASDNPDLRRFKSAGGKLMIAQGWDDSGSYIPLTAVDYYEMVEKTMGGRASTQDFVRLFMAPGRAHCGRGIPSDSVSPGANAVDYLGYMETWVEQGRAPDVIIGAHVVLDDDMESRVENGDYGVFVSAPKDPANVKFTRPIYPYPLQARYKRKGDPNDYRSFEPVEPRVRAE